MISDNELVELANTVDTTIAKLMAEYEISGLVISSVILARLMVLTEMTKDNNDFRKIMKSALDTEPFNERVLQ
jgi:hypothetical protein